MHGSDWAGHLVLFIRAPAREKQFPTRWSRRTMDDGGDGSRAHARSCPCQSVPCPSSRSSARAHEVSWMVEQLSVGDATPSPHLRGSIHERPPSSRRAMSITSSCSGLPFQRANAPAPDPIWRIPRYLFRNDRNTFPRVFGHRHAKRQGFVAHPERPRRGGTSAGPRGRV